MISLTEFHFDRLSFWLGFLAACLLWWLFGRARPLFSIIRGLVRTFIARMRQSSASITEEAILRESVRRSQSWHIASALFPLDDIVIEPALLLPPVITDPQADPLHLSIAGQIIPYTPDWPEISSLFGVPEISLFQAIQNGQNIVIIGQPGAGKTVALAYLACQLARMTPDGKSTRFIPILTHILDFSINPDQKNDPYVVLVNGISGKGNILQKRRIEKYLRVEFNENNSKILLLVDGLDELSPTMLEESVQWIDQLIKDIPQIQIVTSASLEYLDGLIDTGFIPLGISAWSPGKRLSFARKWTALWQKIIGSELAKNPAQPQIDITFIDHWLNGEEHNILSPLEWTMRLWGACAGDLSGCNPNKIYQSHLKRYLPDPGQTAVLHGFAAAMLKEQTTSVSFEFATKASLNEQVIDRLISGGILFEHANGQVRLSNPAFFGFLAAGNLTDEELIILSTHQSWSAITETFHFATSGQEQSIWIDGYIQTNSEAPLYQNFLTACRWLRDAPVTASWRSELLKTLVILLQDEKTAFCMRLRFAIALYLSRDASLPKFYKRLLASPLPDLRRVALICLGASGDRQVMDDILRLLADPVSEVRLTACLALSAIPGKESMNALIEVLLNGDEEIRQAAAESLASNKVDGHKMLKEAAGIKDILTRRAAVFGLLKIHENWSLQLLEKISLEDEQWVVRNAAVHAVETQQLMDANNLSPLPPSWEAPWLLSFASQSGSGILPGQDPVDVLLQVIKSGKKEERIAGLYYLRNHPTEMVIETIYALLSENDSSIQEHAILTLWLMRLSGIVLPDLDRFRAQIKTQIT